MPSPKPSARRASGGARPPKSGRKGTESSGSSRSDSVDKRSTPYGAREGAERRRSNPTRTPRDGGERRILRRGDESVRRPLEENEQHGRRDERTERRPRPGAEARETRPSRSPSRDPRSADRFSRDDRTERRSNSGRATESKRAYSRPPRELTPEESDRQRADSHARGKGWGGVARKGAVNIKSTGQAMEITPSAGRTPDPLSQWVEEIRPMRAPAATSVKPKVKYTLPGDVAADIRKAFIGTAYMREKMVMTLTKAAEAYDRKRFEEALRLGRAVADATPGVAPVRELTGLAAYRAERWNMAKIHLSAHFAITGDPEHLPLVMDCDRASRRYRAVDRVFEQLEGSEPTAEVLVEGRIVMASAWADQKKYAEAIELLSRAGATKQLRNPSFRHVRLWYSLADIFDRAGDVGSARELFARVVIAEPEAYDAASRLTELGASAPRKNRKRRAASVSKKRLD